MEPGAAFDLVRASVNLVLAGLLIALGTSFKLPLSTTYVTFMVGMGTSLADRAWGRESAVGRVTGVMSVIGGWFITAGAAFIIAIIIATIMRYGGFIAMIALIAVALFLLFNSHLIRRKKGDADDELFVAILNAEDPTTMWSLLSEHVRQNQISLLDHVSQDYLDLTNGLFSEDLRRLKKTMHHLDEHKRAFKTMRRKETIGLRRMASDEDMLEKNMWFHLGANTCLQMIYALERATEVAVEHVDNNYNPIPEEYRAEFAPIRDRVIDYIAQVHQLISSKRMEDAKKAKNMGNSTQTASTTAENDHSLFDSSANGGQTCIIHLDVQGMTCASCVGRVERKLRKIPGVDPAVNLPLESARVTVPADITDEQIIETVNNAGYTASLKTEVRDAASEERTNARSGGLGWRIVVALLSKYTLKFKTLIRIKNIPFIFDGIL